jgi:hypothetical protein
MLDCPKPAAGCSRQVGMFIHDKSGHELTAVSTADYEFLVLVDLIPFFP